MWRANERPVRTALVVVVVVAVVVIVARSSTLRLSHAATYLTTATLPPPHHCATITSPPHLTTPSEGRARSVDQTHTTPSLSTVARAPGTCGSARSRAARTPSRSRRTGSSGSRQCRSAISTPCGTWSSSRSTRFVMTCVAEGSRLISTKKQRSIAWDVVVLWSTRFVNFHDMPQKDLVS